jgi:cyclohexa-1,5-dienecarbonyl-CoA hydratase
MNTDAVKLSIEDGIGQLVLSNPPRNILTRAVLGQIRTGLRELEADESLRVVVISAEGKHFSVGADVGEHLPPHYPDLISEFLDTVRVVHGFPLPVLAAVRGRCLGAGFELVVAADIVIAGEDTSFGQPEIMLGVFPPAACAMLPDNCPRGMAAELVFTGDAVDAREAQRAGLVRHVVPDERVEEEALDLAKRIARHSGAALRHAKHALRHESMDHTDGALQHAGHVYVAELMETKDAIEGLQAFLEKRRPVWSNE